MGYRRGTKRQAPEGIFTDLFQSRREIIEDALTNAALNGTSTLRPGGLTEVCVVATTTAFEGLANQGVRIILEGSNDGGTNWHIIASLTGDELLSANAQSRAIGEAAGSVVHIGSWQRIRVRGADGTGEAGTWSATVRMSGTGASAQGYIQTDTVVGAALNVTTNGTALNRPGGARYGIAQAVITGFAGGGALTVNLQGSPDGGTTWITIADATGITANSSNLLDQDGSREIDFGAFDTYRFQAVGSGGNTAHTATCFVSSDATDALGARHGGESLLDTNVLSQAICNLQAPPNMVSTPAGSGSGVPANPGAENDVVANERIVELQLVRLDGSALGQTRRFRLVLSDTASAGDGDLATIATFTGISDAIGTIIFGTGTNEVIVISDGNGRVRIRILDAGAETVRLLGATAAVPNAAPFFIAFSEEVALVFA